MNEKQFELSRYELSRKPQELILDETEIKVQRKSLNALLMCPICLDVLRNTMTTKECLHRFCSECITTALRSGNKECPTCRKRLVSRRSLRHDPIFDALIAKLYPSREVYEKEQDDLLNEVIKKHHGELIAGNKGRKNKHKQNNDKQMHKILDEDGIRENGKTGSGVKRGFSQIESSRDSALNHVTDEISIVLMGRNVERNKYITLKNTDQDQLPKIGHVKKFLEETDSSLASGSVELHSLDGEKLNSEDEITRARCPSLTGVLKIIYEK
jgi:hypothetical protein